jgi:hypothetical protein
MSTSRLIHHAHLVWRTERVIAELRLKQLLGNLGLQAFAMLMARLAMLLFELAAYFALVQCISTARLRASSAGSEQLTGALTNTMSPSPAKYRAAYPCVRQVEAI